MATTAEERWAELQQQWGREFGEEFDVERWKYDPGYRDRVISWTKEGDVGRFRDRASLLSETSRIGEEIDFTKKTEKPDFPEIPKEEIEGIYKDYRGDINRLADERRMSAKRDISQAYRGASERASESLAGTGLGRSGVAANVFQGIETSRAGAVERALGKIEEARVGAQADVSMKEAQFDLSQKLAEQGWDAENIQNAIAFMRQMRFEEYQYQLAEEYGPSEFQQWMDSLTNLALGGYAIASL